MNNFESLLQDALYAYDNYTNSKTCSKQTYKAQADECWSTQNGLIAAIEAAINAKQAEIDLLMLEFCPERMTEEQIAEWEAHQVPCDDDTYNEVCAKLGLPTR